MSYPLTTGLPLLLSLVLQGLLWAGVLAHIEWLNRLALLGIAAGGLGIASIALVIYHLLALEKNWSLSIVLAILLQAAALANSVLFLYSAYVGAFPSWMG